MYRRILDSRFTNLRHSHISVQGARGAEHLGLATSAANPTVTMGNRPYLKPWISCCTYFFPSPCENTGKPRAPSIGDQTPHTAITIFVCDCSRVINKSCDIELRLSYVPMYECQRSEPVPIPTHLRPTFYKNGLELVG
jgi:hypothetical protein